MSAKYIQMHLRLDFIIVANTMSPDQTAPLQSDLVPSCVQYRQP